MREILMPIDDVTFAIVAEQAAKYASALDRIASWDEGATVTSSFNEPNAARIARNALTVQRGKFVYGDIDPKTKLPWCLHCHGTGDARRPDDSWYPCPVCDGSRFLR